MVLTVSVFLFLGVYYTCILVPLINTATVGCCIQCNNDAESNDSIMYYAPL